MISLEEARQRILDSLPDPAAEQVPVTMAPGRVLLKSVTSSVNLPPFDNSAMDGFAVQSKDVSSASPAAPARLQCIGEIPAGESSVHRLQPGQCFRIYTGSPLPEGADAVVMQEDAVYDSNRSGPVRIQAAVQPWENVRFRGEDVALGKEVLPAGIRIQPRHLALAGAIGCETLSVGRRPKVALMATGSELVEPGGRLNSGQIYESNRHSVAAMISALGAQVSVLPLVADDPEATRNALKSAFDNSDMVVTTGGVSVGEKDHVKAAFEALGGRLEFWRIAMRPGKPFVHGTFNGHSLFGLPGNPVSAMVTAWLLVVPAVLRFQGQRNPELPSESGVLGEEVSNPGGRRHFMRVSRTSDGTYRPSGVQASHHLLSMAAADGLLDIAAGETIPKGTAVRVLKWDVY